MSVFWLRAIRLGLILSALAVATVPLVVLLDLSAGGTGWGLCPRGLAGCDTPYTAGPELASGLAIAMFALIAGIRVVSRLIRRVERDQQLSEAQRRLTPQR
jgi:hypothetical protein